MALLSTDPLDIRLAADGDLYIGPNGPELIGGAEGVAQLIGIAIRLRRGEWFVNLDAGLPWHEEFLGEKYDEALLRRRLIEVIATVPGVVETTALTISFDNQGRAVTVDWEVRVKFDDTEPDIIAGRTVVA